MKVKEYIADGVTVVGLDKEAIQKVKKDLTFSNKAYESSIKYGKATNPNISATFKYWSYNKKENSMYFPRGYVYYLNRYLRGRNIEIKIKDGTLLLPQIEVEFQGELRDYQKDAVTDALKYPIGVVEAPTGSGKTVMGLAIIAERKQPTLIIVHTKELLHQWKESAKKFLGIDIGLIGDGVNDVKPITVGIINSIRNKTEELKDKFGQVVCDEVHRCPASTWTDCLINFPARHILGLSATPFRNDGLTHAINAFMGPKMHLVNLKKLQKSGAVLKPVLYVLQSKFSCPHASNYQKMVKSLINNVERNWQIANSIANDLKTFDDGILVVSDRVNHCEMISQALFSLKIDNRILHGKVSADVRKEIIEEVKSGKVKVILATAQLIGEGFDAPGLSALYITTPLKYSGRVIQIVGRILRPKAGKTARLYDVRDNRERNLRVAGQERDLIYKKQWGI